jgi:hypothetical protein
MRCLITLIAVVSLVGCTTLRPIEDTSAGLQQRITSNELLKPGDHVLIITTDNKVHTFTVAKVDSGVIEGRSISIPVDQVVSVEKREFSKGETIALVVATILVIGGLVAIAAAHTAPAFALK